MPKIKTPFHVRVKVTASARKEKVTKLDEGRYEIAVKEPAEDNRANHRVLEIVRGLHAGMRVTMTAGHRAPRKTFTIS